MKKEIYFEDEKLVVKVGENIKTYPVDEIEYKGSCSYCKRASSNFLGPGVNYRRYLNFYHNNKHLGEISDKYICFEDIFDCYNLKIRKTKIGREKMVFVKRPTVLTVSYSFCYYAAISILVGAISLNSILWKMGAALLMILITAMYFGAKYKVYFDENKIKVKYPLKTKNYSYDDVKTYDINNSFFNNNMEYTKIAFWDGKEINIDQ